MSWGYWGIVISLGTLIVMLIACLRLLSSNRKEDRQGMMDGAGGSGDIHSEPPTISRRAA